MQLWPTWPGPSLCHVQLSSEDAVTLNFLAFSAEKSGLWNTFHTSQCRSLLPQELPDDSFPWVSPSLISQGHEELEEAASHAVGWLQGKPKPRLGRNDTEPLSMQIFLLTSEQPGQKPKEKPGKSPACAQGQCPLTLPCAIPPLPNTGTSPSPGAATGCDSHPHYSHPPRAASSFLWNHVSAGAEAAHFCAGTSESTGRIKECQEFPSLILSVRLKVVSSTSQQKRLKIYP